MNWSKAKSILIITFIFLNAFLIIQLKELDNANQISLLTEVTIQERLDEMNIKIEVPLLEEKLKGFHIVGRNIPFSNQAIQSLENQKVITQNDMTIYSSLNEPFKIEPNTQYEQFLSTYVINSEMYQFTRLDDVKKQVHFMQMYNDRVMYSFEEAPLILQLDELGRIVSYQQNKLEIDEQGREQEFLSSLKAIEILLNEQVIKPNQAVEDIEFGYYSFFKLQGDIQVFAPMWRIAVNNERYLVNAIDGSIQDIS
jgi:regulatory protein YycI of two-component signal transduction system YycFG